MNKIKQYFILMRFNQPTGLYLLLLPCLWSLAVTGNYILDIKLLIIFIFGSIVTRSMGCIINDLIDIDIDNNVERTKNRPLTSKMLCKKEAYILIFVLAITGLIIVSLLNRKSFYIAIIASAFMIIYPFMKRITYFPQVFLGITFNLGILMVSTATANKVTNQHSFLYMASIFWSLGYDTIYGHQDKLYDKKLGLKSTALIFTNHSKFAIVIYYILMYFMLIICAIFANLNSKFFVYLSLIFILIFYNIKKLNLDQTSKCANNFKYNRIYGILILLSIIFCNSDIFI